MNKLDRSKISDLFHQNLGLLFIISNIFNFVTHVASSWFLQFPRFKKRKYFFLRKYKPCIISFSYFSCFRLSLERLRPQKRLRPASQPPGMLFTCPMVNKLCYPSHSKLSCVLYQLLVTSWNIFYFPWPTYFLLTEK